MERKGFEMVAEESPGKQELDFQPSWVTGCPLCGMAILASEESDIFVTKGRILSVKALAHTVCINSWGAKHKIKIVKN